MAKNDLVVKSNRLVEASYRITLVEQQIILYAICRSREEQRGLSSETPVTISALDFARQFGADEDRVYGQLKEAMNTLYSRSVIIHDIDPETKNPRVTKTRWISAASYIDGAGKIQIVFAPLIIPFIVRLEKEFTAYRLEKIGHMTSIHAVRLYELLVQYLSIGSRELEIKWLKETLQVADEYPRIDNFKRRVIDVAETQINTHSDIRVSYTQRKTGRNVTHLNFTIRPEKVAPRPTKLVINRAYVEQHARPGESYDDAFRRLLVEAHGK